MFFTGWPADFSYCPAFFHILLTSASSPATRSLPPPLRPQPVVLYGQAALLTGFILQDDQYFSLFVGCAFLAAVFAVEDLFDSFHGDSFI